MDATPEDILNQESDEKTAFNSSMVIIQRLSNLELSLISSLLYKRYDESLEFLRLIYSEIDFTLKEQEMKEIDVFVEYMKELEPLALESFYHNSKRIIKNYVYYKIFIEGLYELKRVLNKLKNKSGLGMLSSSDPSRALES